MRVVSHRPDRNPAGQTQILGVMVITTAMLTGGLFALDYASRSQITQIGQTRGIEMRMALESGTRYAQQLWRNNAGCDRVVFNDLLNRVHPDGSISPTACASTDDCRRQLEVTINNREYRIAFGPIDPARNSAGTAPWESSLPSTEQPYPSTGGTPRPGIAQDILLELWTRSGGQTSGVPGRRLIQRIVLVNGCAPTCSGVTSISANAVASPPESADDDPICHSRDAAVDYGVIRSPGSYPSSTLPSSSSAARAAYSSSRRTCSSTVGSATLNRNKGDANSASEGAVDALDLRSLIGFIRQYDTTRTVIAPPASTPDASANNCGDLDGDDRVTERDAGLLEKALRGYLFWLPVAF